MDSDSASCMEAAEGRSPEGFQMQQDQPQTDGEELLLLVRLSGCEVQGTLSLANSPTTLLPAVWALLFAS